MKQEYGKIYLYYEFSKMLQILRLFGNEIIFFVILKNYVYSEILL